jgi:hypothetical protein
VFDNEAWLTVTIKPAVYAGGLEAENQIAMGLTVAINISLGILKKDYLGAFSMRNNSSTVRHPYDWGSSLSLSGNLTLGGGLIFELGFAWDNDGDYTWFFSLGPSIGFDASIGILAKSYEAVNPKIGFDVRDLAGYGSAWNIAVSYYDGTYGGNLKATQWNPFDFGFTYYEYGGGASYGSLAGLTFETTYTWIFGTKGKKR